MPYFQDMLRHSLETNVCLTRLVLSVSLFNIAHTTETGDLRTSNTSQKLNVYVNRRRTLTTFCALLASNRDQAIAQKCWVITVRYGASNWSKLEAGPWSIALAGSHARP
jgi:hypothetical protein